MKYRLRWERDKVTRKLVDQQVKDEIERERFAIFGQVTLAQELLPRFAEYNHLPFLNLQVGDSGRAGDRAGAFEVWIAQDGDAWIEWRIEVTDVSSQAIKKHQIKNFDGMLSHQVARIERKIGGKWE